MNVSTSAPGAIGLHAAHARYIFLRVIDALLREDVRGCVSRATRLAGAGLPAALAAYRQHDCQWLRIDHLGDGTLWVPVRPARFMQELRGAGLPLVSQDGTLLRELHSAGEVAQRFARGLGPEAASLYTAFGQECEVALAHRAFAEALRTRWFMTAEDEPADWHGRLLHFDRLASFLDHPLYPTARAKLGFDEAALQAYAPESQQAFMLRWLAVPHELHRPAGALRPPCWPSFADVGLEARLAATHALIPVHPFVWDHQLDAMLAEAGLDQQVVRAPQACLGVKPTLSVRTVALLACPEWHLKLPLTIRTLGARNIRTIKPSTIGDGHRIQTVLGMIAAREPAIAGRLLLTDEESGAHVDGRSFLGYILRRYPEQALRDSTPAPIAALLAPTASGALVVEQLAGRFYGGDLRALFADYLELTLRLHLTLWVRYGIALESNQQNSMLVLSHGEPRMRLLLKDNDAARIDLAFLERAHPDLARGLAALEDARIGAAGQLALAQMFTTITLQLNIAVLVEGIAGALGDMLYPQVRGRIEAILDDLERQGECVAAARRALLGDERLYAKYLLIAATLADKAQTGALDVNKFYGHSAPNFLRPACAG